VPTPAIKEQAMRKIFAFIMTTVDGYYEGPNQDFDFWVIDDEFNEFSVQQLDEADALAFGRVTYEGMAAYWPTSAAEADDSRVATRMNTMPKIVVSRTLDRAEWTNTQVISAAEDLATLKQEPGKHIAVLGSPNLTASLMQLGLIDELRIMVNPVVLGTGKSVFNGANGRIGLNLVRTRPFDSGNVLLYYEPGAANEQQSAPATS
jgi:dihydrofolate reductase